MKSRNHLLASLGLVLIAGLAIAGLSNRQNTDFYGENDFRGPLKKLGTTITATAAELNIMDGVTATAAEINAVADRSATASTLTPTNGEAITLPTTGGYIILSPIGGANNGTNTCTISSPWTANIEYTFVVHPDATNRFKVADNSELIAIGHDVTMSNSDTMVIYTRTTTNLVKVSFSDN